MNSFILEIHAIKAALAKSVFLLDYANSSREFSDITKAIVKLIEIPHHLKTEPKPSVGELLRRLKKVNDEYCLVLNLVDTKLQKN